MLDDRYQGFTILENKYREGLFYGAYRPDDRRAFVAHISKGGFPDGTKIVRHHWLPEPVDARTIDSVVSNALKELA